MLKDVPLAQWRRTTLLRASLLLSILIAAEQNRENLDHPTVGKSEKEDTGELQKEEDDLNAYRCLILEEHPSKPNDN